jgi:hypothetical protein
MKLRMTMLKHGMKEHKVLSYQTKSIRVGLLNNVL